MPGYTCLADRSVITLEGPDRLRFLDALITNTCPEAGMAYAALLTAQGRVLSDLFIQSEPDRLLLDCDASLTGEVLQILNRYRLRSAVSITDDGLDYAAYAFNHAFAGAFPDPRLPALGWRAILPRIGFTDTSLTDISQSYDEQRIKLGVPRGALDMPDKQALPLECNLDHLHGISFTKGCYPGQELTARMHHRSLLRRRLLPIECDTAELTTGQILLSADGVEEGILRSTAGHLALALVRIEAFDTLATVNGHPIKILWPEWLPNEGAL